MMSSSKRVKFASDGVIDRFLDNVDVWQAIFEMLSGKDRIRLEMTNKRLRILMFEYWKRVTSFDVNCLKGISYNSSTNKNREKVSAALVAICVNRIGDCLRSLTIREKLMPKVCWTENLPSIGEGCLNIETINFVNEDRTVKREKLDIHFDSFSRLKTLTVRPVGWLISASASVFLSIPTSIEVIRGLRGRDEGPFENAAQMEGFFAHRPSLREVRLGLLLTGDESKADIFRVIAERCPHLKSIELSSYNDIDYHGVIALESMKEYHIPKDSIHEMEIVTICERSPFVEVLELGLALSSNIDLQSAALTAVGALTKLVELRLYTDYADVVAPSLVTDFVRELARNSGASLLRLHLPSRMPLPKTAIEALANYCGKLRYVQFCVRVGEVTPASIRFLIDCIVGHPSWIYKTGETTLTVKICLMCGDGVDAEAFKACCAALKALAEPAANMPAGVWLHIW